jgi:hypothetical protein
MAIVFVVAVFNLIERFERLTWIRDGRRDCIYGLATAQEFPNSLRTNQNGRKKDLLNVLVQAAR